MGFRRGEEGGKRALILRDILCEVGSRPGLEGGACPGTIAPRRFRGEWQRGKKKIESLEQFVWAAPGLPRFYRCLDGRPGEKRCL